MLNKDYFAVSGNEVLGALNSCKNGLSEAEAKQRLLKYGENKLKEPEKKSGLFVFLSQFSDIMIIILLIASAISITIAIVNQSYNELVDGFIILTIVMINAIIGFAQEKKAENSLETLKKLTEPEAKVKRNNILKKVHNKQLVVGDIISLEAGDIVPADCRLLETIAFKVDESSLTGESVSVEKFSNLVLNQNTILADRKNMTYSGAVVVNGRALAIVVATGENTEIGKIANLIQNSKKDETPLQKGIKQIGKFTTYLVLAICAITFVIEVCASPNSPLEAFLTAVAVAVAAIPESLPAVITIIMSLGIARLAKRKAIVKRLNAVETLGSCEVVCSDKTGTLTQNKMEVQSIFLSGRQNEVKNDKLFNDYDYQKFLSIMFLCESAAMSIKGFIGDPTEIAILEFAEKSSKTTQEQFLKSYQKVGEIPFDSKRKLMSTVYNKNGEIEVYSKGAVDELLKICTHILIENKVVVLTPSLKEKILNANKNMANEALRVLGFAYKKITPLNIDEKYESNLTFVGLTGMQDPPRKEVARAVMKCKKAGILPIMITGDHKSTALAIARKIGLADNINEVITGAEIDNMPDEKFFEILKIKKVFARVSPENKVRIVDGLKKSGKIVAMTGDGVNDAPSIKNASIGIGMGITGTDITKEVADVIITDDNFATIIVAIEEGRKIYTNIQKTVQFLFSANLAEITAIFLATIFMPELIFLTPVQILFVNLISDTLPAVALGLEPAEKNIMEKSPRNSKSGLFSNGVGKNILIIGIFQGLIMLSCFFFGYFILHSEAIATTMAFYALNVIQFFYFISMRTNESTFKNSIFQNKFAVLAVVACFGFVAIVALTPLSTLLGLVALPFVAWLIILLCCVLMFIVSEINKKLNRVKKIQKK